MDTIFTTIKQTYESNPNYWIFIGYWVAIYFITYFLVYITEPKDKKGYLIGPLGLNFIINTIIFGGLLYFICKIDNEGVKNMDSFSNFLTDKNNLYAILLTSIFYISIYFILSKILVSPDGGGASITPITTGIIVFSMFYLKNNFNKFYITDFLVYFEWFFVSSAIILGMTERNAIDRLGIEDKPYDKY